DNNCNGFIGCDDPACAATTFCRPAIAPTPGLGGAGAGSGAGSCVVLDQAFPPACCDPFTFGPDACPSAFLGAPFDPNFKAADPSTNVFGYGYAQAGQTITYTIHYENIGTADAHDVSVLDPLHANLDETT